MHATVFFKTDAGKQEILERSRKVASGVRSILLMVDGQRNETELTELMASLHAPPDTLQQLLGLGLIVAARQDELVAEASASSKRPSLSAGMSSSPPAVGEKYLALYALMTDSIRAHLGLKGYFMQLKVERCTDLDALQSLLPEMANALSRAKDHAFATRWLQSAQAAIE
jgi:hypothetical protein